MNPKTILVVDDEPSITRLLKLNLERTGSYAVREENDGAQALAAIRKLKPDLVLLDLLMPQVDGTTVAAGIRNDPELRHMPIVFLSAAARKGEPAAGEGVFRGFPCIPKPFELQGMLRIIEQNLR